MATLATLRTRLKRRLGLAVVSAAEQSRLGEALNSGIARAISDGVPGLSHDTYIGATYGTLGLTDCTVTANSSTVTSINCDGATDNIVTHSVFPHDILVVDVGGTQTKFLIRDVLRDVELDIGSPAVASLEGGTDSYIIRRSIKLPSTGQVISVHRLGSSNKTTQLTADPMWALVEPFKTGTSSRYYEQRYSETQGSSFLSIWPAPDDATIQYVITQTRFKAEMTSDSDELKYPEEALDAVLERARLAYLTWKGTADQVDAAMTGQAVRDTADSLKNSSNAEQIFTKQ